jgi:amino acid transporter
MKKVLGPFSIAMINVAAIASLKNLPFAAGYGLPLIFLYAMAALVFFIPLALVCTELVTHFPKGGGVYLWVKEAFGPKVGFLAIWLQWFENVFYYPSILSFIAVTLGTLISPKLGHNHWFVFFTILIVFWGATWMNFKGIKLSARISSFGAVAGTLVPTGLIIFLGVIWFLAPTPNAVMFTDAVFPELNSINDLALFAGIILSFAGLEMSEVHAGDVKDPHTSFPKAIAISSILIFIVYALGSFSIAIVVPKQELNIISGVIDAYRLFFKGFNLEFLIPLIGLLIVIGAIATVSTWIIGPSRGLFIAAKEGNLPKIFQKHNRFGAPVAILVAQGIVVTILSILFLFMPTISSTFWVLSVMTVQLYLIMYILLFLSAIKLRHKLKAKGPGFKIPLGSFGIWLCSILGITTACFIIFVSFFPPPQLGTIGNIYIFESILLTGIVLGLLIPFILTLRKEETKPPQQLPK